MLDTNHPSVFATAQKHVMIEMFMTSEGEGLMIDNKV